MLPENKVIDGVRQMLQEYNIFLVGGYLRDYLLEQNQSLKNEQKNDVDLLLEGDIFSLIERLTLCEANVVTNKNLLTVSFQGEWGVVDIAAARHEFYPFPGALPVVTPTSWQEDIKRRDYTINTLLMPLKRDGWGGIIDLAGGYKDLSDKLLRILHTYSYRDDPTRILRGIRLKNRLRFQFEEATLSCLLKSWTYLLNISPQRRFNEWANLCREKNINDCLQEIYDLGGWNYFFKGLPAYTRIKTEDVILLDDSILKDFRYWFYYLLQLLSAAEYWSELAVYWGLSEKEQKKFFKTLSLANKIKDSCGINLRQLYRLSKELPVESIFYLYSIYAKATAYSLSWPEFYRGVQETKLPISGRDLLALGLSEGPEIGSILRRLEKYFEGGLFTNRKEGLRIAASIIKEEKNAKEF